MIWKTRTIHLMKGSIFAVYRDSMLFSGKQQQLHSIKRHYLLINFCLRKEIFLCMNFI